MTLLVGGFALCGCDFTNKAYKGQMLKGLPGMRASSVLEALPTLLEADAGLLLPVSGAWSDADRDVLGVIPALEQLTAECADVLVEEKKEFVARGEGRRGSKPSTIDALVDGPVEHPDLYAKAAWVMAYWNFNERLDVQAFCFRPPPTEIVRSADLQGASYDSPLVVEE